MPSRSAEYTRLQTLFADEALLGLSDDDGETVFPNGSAMAICTNCAERVIAIVGRGDVWGYASEDNPDTAAATGQDGHDFAVIDDRYIVDVWLCFFAGITSRSVFDLLSRADATRIHALYGPPDHWRCLSNPDRALRAI
jgi:hypothetical protein